MESRKERINTCRENLSFLSFRVHANETRVLPGGVCRGSGEAHSVSDLKIKNRCRGRTGKITQLAKVAELLEVIRVMMILGRFLEMQIEGKPDIGHVVLSCSGKRNDD